MEKFVTESNEGAPPFPAISEAEVFSDANISMMYRLGGMEEGDILPSETESEYITRIQNEHRAEKASRSPEEQATIDKKYEAEADRLRTLPDTSACELR